MTTAAEPATVVWTRRSVRITAGLSVAIFIAALDSSVVATAIPTIAGELGDFSLYPWLIAGYLLTSTTTVPLWGRRRMLMVGLAWLGIGVLVAVALRLRGKTL